MAELQLILSVAALFLIRIGLPLLVLVVVGTLIDHWQLRRETAVERQMRQRT